MSKVWKDSRKNSFENYKEGYYVNMSRLVEDEYYGPDGMWDRATDLPLDEWKVEVIRKGSRGRYNGETIVLERKLDSDLDFFYINMKVDHISFEEAVEKALALGGELRESRY